MYDNPAGLSVVEAKSYTEAKAESGFDSRLLDEIQQNFDLRLANDPYLGKPIPYFGNLYVLVTTPYLPRVPSFRVLYRYDPAANPEQVELLALESVSAEDNDS